MIAKLKWMNLVLRVVMEIGIIVAFGYWGFTTGRTNVAKMLLCIIVPVIAFGFWGLIDFHQFDRYGEVLRLIQELVICGFATFLLYKTGAIVWAWALAVLSVVHHVLVYVLGERLLKRK